MCLLPALGFSARAEEPVMSQAGEALLVGAEADALTISAPSVCLMEASTGQVIYEKNADEPRSPASITKIMTLILIFDALASGKIQMDT